MKYKIKEIRPNIFAVVVKDDYERAMLFCRVQEFYESPRSSFRDKKFSIWDYFKWYSKENFGSFSYPNDFVGFNFPLVVAKKCYEMNELETPYDIEMKKIVDDLYDDGKRMDFRRHGAERPAEEQGIEITGPQNRKPSAK